MEDTLPLEEAFSELTVRQRHESVQFCLVSIIALRIPRHHDAAGAHIQAKGLRIIGFGLIHFILHA
jgi:hypothetical protein